jgi:uncharacterized protein (DUF952 family)
MAHTSATGQVMATASSQTQYQTNQNFLLIEMASLENTPQYFKQKLMPLKLPFTTYNSSPMRTK